MNIKKAIADGRLWPDGGSDINALLEACRLAADAAESRAIMHRRAYEENKQQGEALRKQAYELGVAIESRRDSITRRWQSRREFRQARDFLSNAIAIPVAGKLNRPHLPLRKPRSEKVKQLESKWLDAASPLPPSFGGPGIYALFLGNELIYIGQSVNIAARLGNHIGKKKFTAASYISVKKEDLDRVERLMIRVFLPKLNVDNVTAKHRRESGMVA